MGYPCPHKGTVKETRNCRKDPESIRGWKHHMTKQHGQYSEGELSLIVGATPPDPERGRSLFLGEMGKPEVLGQETEARETTSVGGEPKEPAPEQQKKIVPIKMKKFKK